MNIREQFVLYGAHDDAAACDQPLPTMTTVGGYACYDSLPQFDYVRAKSVAEAVALLRAHGKAAVLMAGGQDLLRRLRDRVHRDSPKTVINIKRIPGLDGIEAHEQGMTIGSAATLSALANHDLVRTRHPMLAQAAYQAGFAQYRNLATVGGDLCREVRCWYFRASGNTYDCRRKCGSQCPALSGDNRHHAIFGSRDCVATCPSDLAPALAVLGATVRIAGAEGERSVPIEDFHAPLKNVLTGDEMVTAIELPQQKPGTHAVFEKATQGGIFDPAIVSVAVALTRQGNVCTGARIALGGVAHNAWRASGAEALLGGRVVDAALAEQAAAAAVADAWPLPVPDSGNMPGNGHKVEIARTLVRRALLAAAH